MEELKFVYLPIDALTPYEKNARKHQHADIDVIKKSIEEFGMNDPIGIWGDKNIIVEGHGRLAALKELGWKEVPCIRLDHLTDEQRKAYALAHNRSAELSTWDFDLLDEELAALKNEFDLEGLGFKDLMEEEPQIEPKDDDFDVDEFLNDKTVSQLGDVFQLGRHTLVCGDCTKKEYVDKLVADKKVDLLLTDPPYNVDYEGEAGTIENDNMENKDFRKFLSSAFKNADRVMKDGASWYVWFADKKSYWVHGAILDVGWEVKQMPVWNKNSLVLGRSKYQFKHEPCYFGWKDKATPTFSDDRTLTTVWDFDRPTHNELHPTMKPVPLFAFLIKNSTKNEKGRDVVLDLFAGSGTTLIASEQTGRTALCMEKSPKYADVIVKRYVRFVGSAEGCTMNGQPLPPDLIDVVSDF